MSVQDLCNKWATYIEDNEGIDVDTAAILVEELGGNPELIRPMNRNENGLGGGNAICLYVLLLIAAARTTPEVRL